MSIKRRWRIAVRACIRLLTCIVVERLLIMFEFRICLICLLWLQWCLKIRIQNSFLLARCEQSGAVLTFLLLSLLAISWWVGYVGINIFSIAWFSIVLNAVLIQEQIFGRPRHAIVDVRILVIIIDIGTGSIVRTSRRLWLALLLVAQAGHWSSFVSQRVTITIAHWLDVHVLGQLFVRAVAGGWPLHLDLYSAWLLFLGVVLRSVDDDAVRLLLRLCCHVVEWICLYDLCWYLEEILGFI